MAEENNPERARALERANAENNNNAIVTALMEEIDERVADMQQNVRFCTYNYPYHHRNDDGIILQHSFALLNNIKDELAEISKGMDRVHKMAAEMVESRNKVEKMLAEELAKKAK